MIRNLKINEEKTLDDTKIRVQLISKMVGGNGEWQSVNGDHRLVIAQLKETVG